MNNQARATDGGQFKKLVKMDITCWSTAVTISKEPRSFNQMMR